MSCPSQIPTVARDYQRQELGSIGPFPPPYASLRSPDPEHLHFATGTQIYATKAFSDHTGSHRHCERSEATQGPRDAAPRLLRRFAPRNDDSDRTDIAFAREAPCLSSA